MRGSILRVEKAPAYLKSSRLRGITRSSVPNYGNLSIQTKFISYIISIVDFASHEFFRSTVLYVLKRSHSKSSFIIKEYILPNVLTWDSRPPCYSKNHAFHWCLLLLFTCSTNVDPFIKYTLEIYSTKINRQKWSSRYNRYHQARHKIRTSIVDFVDLNIVGWDPWVSSLDTSFSLGTFSGLAVVFTESDPWSTSSCRIYSFSLVMVQAYSRVSSSNFHVLSTQWSFDKV